MRRTEARELLMQLMFQMEIQNDYGIVHKDKFMKEYMEGSNQLDYFNRLYELIIKNLVSIDEKLELYSENWKINRMAKVDLAILRLSVAEILYMDDVPDSASINEAVDMAKKFGGEDSGKFINGILGKVARSKAGRKRASAIPRPFSTYGKSSGHVDRGYDADR